MPLSTDQEQAVFSYLRSNITAPNHHLDSLHIYNSLGGKKFFRIAFAPFQAKVRESRRNGAFPGFTCQQRWGWVLDDGHETDRLKRLTPRAVKPPKQPRYQHAVDDAPETGPASSPAPVVMALPMPTATREYPLEIQNLMEKENASFSIKMAEMSMQFMQGMMDAMKEHTDNLRMLVATAKQMNG